VADKSPEFLLRMLKGVPGVVYAWLVRPDGTSEMVYMNERGSELFGLTMEQLEADPMIIATCWHPDDQAAFQDEGMRAMAERRQYAWSGRLRRSDGSYRWVRCISEPEFRDDGSVLWFGSFFDISGEKDIEIELRASQAARRQEEDLFRAVIDTMPVGVSVMNAQGKFIVFNRAAGEIAGKQLEDGDATDIAGSFGVFLPDRETPFPEADLPIVRALQGERAGAEMFVRNAGRPGGALLRVDATPLRGADGSPLALALSRDVTQQREMEEELRQRNRQLASSEEEKNQLVARLRYAIDELSNPILEVWDDVLAMPLVGVVDSRRTADMAQRLLAEVSRTQAQWVIIDLTGVEVVDTKTADNLIKLVRKVELIGARCLLTGIRPSVAETVVEIGVDFAGLVTLRNLKHGLQEALERNRKRNARPERDDDEDPPRRRRRDD